MTCEGWISDGSAVRKIWSTHMVYRGSNVHPGSEWVMEGPEVDVERSKVLNVETVGTLWQGLFGGWISAS